MRTFQREKKIFCGNDFLEVDIFSRTVEQEKKIKGKKRKKEYVPSPPKQVNLNDINARRYFTQLANANFSEKDLHFTLTYSKKYLPKSIEDAEKEIYNYLRRVSYRRGKEGLPALKYILITEYSTGDNEEKPTRIHHHIFMNGGLERDRVESLWCKKQKKGQKQGYEVEFIGYINADRLKPDENGLAALCEYLTKSPNKKKRWSSSQNLVKPWSRDNDGKYSRKQVEKLCKEPPDSAFWEKEYKGYRLINNEYGWKPVYNEITGWALYVKLRRKT